MLFADDLGQVMSVEKEARSDVEEIPLIENTNSSKGRIDNYSTRNNNSKNIDTCYISGRTGYFALTRKVELSVHPHQM